MTFRILPVIRDITSDESRGIDVLHKVSDNKDVRFRPVEDFTFMNAIRGETCRSV